MGQEKLSDQEEVNELIKKLELATTLKKRGKATKRIYKVLNSDKEIVSWKFNEWDYAKDKIELPSNARGLFTLADEPRIAVRGYDKFFNINEVPITRWEWLESNTKGPYQVTAKENGCIILISGLRDGTIVVCSKHSTGDRQDGTKNHAIAGQKFLEHQLKLRNLSTKDLALKLYDLNVTAVAEFCDDDFEEHIIQYKSDSAGLYLHGLNLNKPSFETYSIEEVSDFAGVYGFKTVDHFTIQDIASLKNRLTEYSLSGCYNGKEIEGFVIRCKKTTKLKEEDYFFKFKFEEPYLMYRQWREVTKEYLSHKDRLSIKFSKHRFITNKYLDFVIPLLEEDPKLAENYNSGFKIIELRNRFLESYGKSGPEILNQELLDELEVVNSMKSLKIDENTKFVIIPVATIGCGKTTTSQTLVNIYSDEWSLVSNDDIPSGKAAKHQFVKKALEGLKTNKVVIMDRNNHQFRERDQIFKDFAEFRDDYIPHDTNVQFICLNFVPDDCDTDKVWEKTYNRVIARGDNHQSIKAETESAKVKGIMSGFVKRFQPVVQEKEPDSNFNSVIDLDSTGERSSYENVLKILDNLRDKYPVLIGELPASGIIESAFSSALNYKPSYHKVMGKSGGQGKANKKKATGEKETSNIGNPTKRMKVKPPVYFSIDIPNKAVVTSRIQDLLIQKGSLANVDKSFGDLLKTKLMNEFHVTLAHCIQAKRGNELEKFVWSKYINVFENRKSKGNLLGYSADLKLKSLIWNDMIATVLVDISLIYRDGSSNELSVKSANKFPHITYALLSEGVKPFFSNSLAEDASKFDDQGSFDNGVHILHFDDEPVLKQLPVIVNF
ncbi:hypothetical protein BN7_1603 [Wickerhamomyces ciferrii]|uniref:tRNA ligase n=1 Tax=Wickerhamomyces ciferrii (strain ATCC 14091 / BCRC 22168 / CBS 111 / JCM 3599 / NBRC 0793 / NRRL Y-1031 F-60-10) TaxID=1206466 RepID=K0KKR6_WICCF|nr:uncharacterized protein BN7_1603 [Wickerhamomyces ciferrii]CCH42064.1 hypothetical protein BN7_1603 [Wickerhamomyces ciferrii]